MHAAAGQRLALLGTAVGTLGASEYLAVAHGLTAGAPPELDLELEARVQACARAAIRDGVAAAVHDTSEGGLLVAVCEMLFAARCGAALATDKLLTANGGRLDRTLFGEAASRVIVAVAPTEAGRLERLAQQHFVPLLWLGEVGGETVRVGESQSVPIERARVAWAGGLER